MSSFIDRLQDRSATPNERARVLAMTDRDADAVLDALSSDTGRETFRTLFEAPATPSEIADRVDTSLQNVHYHLSNLEAAGLIEPIDTVYSGRGYEMTVYGPASDPLVFVGNGTRLPRIERSISEVVGGLALLAVASVFVQWGAERLLWARNEATGVVGPAGRESGTTLLEGTAAWYVFEVIEPGVLFFASCLAVAAIVTWTFDGR